MHDLGRDSTTLTRADDDGIVDTTRMTPLTCITENDIQIDDLLASLAQFWRR